MTKLLAVIPPHAVSMLNGPPLAPFLLRYFLAGGGVETELFDGNALFFRWLIEEEQRSAVAHQLGRRVDAYLHRPSLSRDDLREFGRLWYHFTGPYCQGGDLSYARSAVDFSAADEVFLSDVNSAGAAWREQLWTRADAMLADEILRRKPDHLAFSILFSTQVEPAVRLASRLRAAGFAGKMIAGGAAVKLMDDGPLEAFVRDGGFDLAYRYNLYGELTDVAELLQGRRTAVEVANAMHLDASGALRAGPSSLFGAKKLAGPLDYAAVDDVYRRDLIFPVLMSEGCYWGRCEFCDYPFLSSQDPFVISALFRDPEAVARDIEQVHRRYGVRFVDLISDAVPLPYFRRLAPALEAAGAHGLASLSCSIRAEPWAKQEYFDDMARCGVGEVTIGVESLCDDILAGMKKGNTFGDTLRSLEYARKAGIRVKTNIIFDYPRMTVGHVRQTMERLDQIAPYIASIGIHSFSLTPHSPLAFDPGSANLVVHAEQHGSAGDHGTHHLTFGRADLDDELRAAFAELRAKLARLSYQLDSRASARPLAPRIFRLPFRWADGDAVAAESGANIAIKTPDEQQPFSYVLVE